MERRVVTLTGFRVFFAVFLENVVVEVVVFLEKVALFLSALSAAVGTVGSVGIGRHCWRCRLHRHS